MESTRKEDTNARQEEDRGQGESQARGESAQARRGRRRQDRLALPGLWWTRNPEVLAGEVRSPRAAVFRGHPQLSTQSGPLNRVAVGIGQRSRVRHAHSTLDRTGWSLETRARAQAKIVALIGLLQRFRVTVVDWKRPNIQRIQVSSAPSLRLWSSYMTVPHADYLLRQVQGAIRRTPRAR